ncbi:head-tail joining protein [Roseateles sp. P5_E7]
MDNSIFFAAFKSAGMLDPCFYKPGTIDEKGFDAGWQRPDVLLMADEAQATDYLLEFQTADLPTLRIGDPITVDGVAYIVRAPAQKGRDGFFSTVALKRT